MTWRHLTGACGALCLASLCAFAFATGAAAQSAAPADAHSHSGKNNAQQQASSAKQNSASPSLRKLAAEHKVITTEDLEKPQAGNSYHLKTASGSPSPDAAQCDAECATEAREIAGFGPDRLGEWDTQFITAKHSLASNTEWRRVYFEALQKTRMYCTFQEQQGKAQAPTGNDYHSRYERAKQEKHEDDMSHTLTLGVQSAVAQINRLIDEADESEPVRAAIMRVLAGRLFNQCASLADP